MQAAEPAGVAAGAVLAPTVTTFTAGACACAAPLAPGSIDMAVNGEADVLAFVVTAAEGAEASSAGLGAGAGLWIAGFGAGFGSGAGAGAGAAFAVAALFAAGEGSDGGAPAICAVAVVEAARIVATATSEVTWVASRFMA